MDQTLHRFYEQKYAAEREAPTIEVVPITRAPLSRYEAVVKFLPQHFRGGDVLEMGAGNGNVALTLLASDLDIKSYTLSDISMPRLEGVKANVSDPRVQILEMDAEKIPESQYGCYDAVIMIALIEHLIDPLGAMMRIRKLLRPDGLCYLDTPNIAKYTQRTKLLLGRFPSTASRNEGLAKNGGAGPVDLFDEGHLHYFTYRSLSLMLTERCGFSRVVKLGYPGGRIPLGKSVHNVLANVWPEMFSELALIAFA